MYAPWVLCMAEPPASRLRRCGGCFHADSVGTGKSALSSCSICTVTRVRDWSLQPCRSLSVSLSFQASPLATLHSVMLSIATGLLRPGEGVGSAPGLSRSLCARIATDLSGRGGVRCLSELRGAPGAQDTSCQCCQGCRGYGHRGQSDLSQWTRGRDGGSIGAP